LPAKKPTTKKRIVGRSIIDGYRTRRGAQMRKGSGWTLISPHGLEFSATLIETIDVDGNRIAL
jgi:hypothetical protein